MNKYWYGLICLCVLWTACSERKVDALYYNKAEQVFEISKASELRYLNEVHENILDQNVKSEDGLSVPLEEVRIKLVDDIKIKGTLTPIASSIKELDGNGHTIEFDDVNYEIESFSNNVGLFESLSNATVKNLVLSGHITIRVQQIDEEFYMADIGALAGTFLGGVIENCTNKVDIDFCDSYDKDKRSDITMGGLVGYSGKTLEEKLSITLLGKIRNEGNLTLNQCRSVTVGGVIGNINLSTPSMRADARLENIGIISVEWAKGGKAYYSSVGGVLGECSVSSACKMEHLYNTGNLLLNTWNAPISLNVGGVAGSMELGDGWFLQLTDVHNKGRIEIKGELSNKQSAIGGVFGSFAHCVFHCVTNSGEIILPAGYKATVGGLLGDENILYQNSYLYSCCKDYVGEYPIWNVDEKSITSKRVICDKNHNTH